MEKHTDYTCNPEYASEWNRLMTKQNAFTERILDDEKRPSKIVIGGIVKVEVEGLWKY